MLPSMEHRHLLVSFPHNLPFPDPPPERLPWTSLPLSSSQTSAAPSSSPSSASSVVVSPADGPDTTQSSGDSGSVLKERDYIGMAEVSSASVTNHVAESGAEAETARSEDLNLEETNLRLGLGPLKEPQFAQKMAPRMQGSLEVKKCELTDVTDVDSRKEATWVDRTQAVRSSQEMAKPEWSVADSLRQRHAPSDMQQRNGSQESRYAFVDGASEQRSLQNVWQGREFPNLPASIPGQDFRSTVFTVPTLKNGVKRAYSEAMADAGRFNAGEIRPGANGGTGTVTAGGNMLHLQEPEGKAPSKHDQAAFLSNWAALKPQVPASWHTGLEPSANPYGSVPSSKPAGLATPRAHKAVDGCAVAWEPRNKPHDHSMSKDNPQHPILDNNQECAANDAPLPKSQVVGWPPIRSYRKNTLAAHPKTAGDEGQIYVKVNMDGVPIGRKVDLNAHTCYEGLLMALEEMFQPQGTSQVGRENDAKPLHLLNGSEFVLTYEDKDGDWMLVGDVPWGMFVDTVRRLRIMRGSEATGLGCSSTR